MPGIAPAYATNAAEVRQAVAAGVEALAGMSESPVFIGPETQPAALSDGAFSVLMPSETNQGQLRDRSGRLVAIRQDVTVRFSALQRPNRIGDQLDDFDTAIGTTAPAIVRDLLAFKPAINGLAVQYIGTDRSVLHKGTWLLVDVQFSIEHRFSV